MLDGHGSEMSRRARETRNRKKNRVSIFNKDKNQLTRACQDKFEVKAQSIHQQEQLAKKVKQLAKEEQIRILIIGGLSLVIFLIILFFKLV